MARLKREGYDEATPPKRNYRPESGRRKTRPTFADPTKGPQSGLGPAYNSARGGDAYTPVPVNPTQVRRTQRTGHSKQNAQGGYSKGDQFLMYRPGTGASSAPKKRRRTGDSWIG